MNIKQIIIQIIVIDHLILNFINCYFIKFVDYLAVLNYHYLPLLNYDYPDLIHYFIHLIKKFVNLIPKFNLIEIHLLQYFDSFILLL